MPPAAMASRPFVDSNVLLYLTPTDAAKAMRAERLLAGRIVVSVQVLNEFAKVARRKQSLDWAELSEALTGIRQFAEVHAVTVETHERGLVLAQGYQLGLYGAMIAAAAIEAGCDNLMSEDFQAGQFLDDCLTIGNPFARQRN